MQPCIKEPFYFLGNTLGFPYCVITVPECVNLSINIQGSLQKIDSL